MTFQEKCVTERRVSGVFGIVIVSSVCFNPTATECPIKVTADMFCFQCRGSGGEVQVFSRMNPCAKTKTAGLLVVRPIRVISLALTVVNAGKDTTDFAFGVDNAGGVFAVALGDVDFSVK